MKYTLYLAFAMVALFLFMQCKTTTYTPDNMPDQKLTFGNGGGISGIETTYTILENGQIFRQVGIGKTLEEIEKISKRKAKKCFEGAEQLDKFATEDFQPGNTYFFVSHQKEDMIRRISWFEGGEDKTKDLYTYYKTLRSYIPKDK